MDWTPRNRIDHLERKLSHCRGELEQSREQVDHYRNLVESEVRLRNTTSSKSNDRIQEFEREIDALRKEVAEHREDEHIPRDSQAAEYRYRTLFDSIDEGLCIVEMIFDDEGKPADYRFLEINSAFERQTGLVNAQGKRMKELRPKHEAHWFDIYGRVALSGEPARFQNPAKELNRWFDVYAFRFGKPEDRLVAILFTDITERKRAEETIRLQAEQYATLLATTSDGFWRFDANGNLLDVNEAYCNEKLVATQQQVVQSEKLAAVGTLAAGVAHELNNPLMGVMGYVGLSQRREQDPEIRSALKNAFHELERMRDLIKNLLGFSRPVVEGELAQVSIQATLERALALLQPDFNVRAITVTSDVPADLPMMLGKSNELQQVFMNLLMNARDAVENCSIKQIRISVHRTDDQVFVKITDTGAGIPPEIQGRIFDPFFTTKPPGKGAGLGLSVAQSIVADFGGSLACDSRVGEGATFTVELPLVRERERITRK